MNTKSKICMDVGRIIKTIHQWIGHLIFYALPVEIEKTAVLTLI